MDRNTPFHFVHKIFVFSDTFHYRDLLIFSFDNVGFTVVLMMAMVRGDGV